MTAVEQVAWQPYREPLHVTLARTGTIALVAGTVLAWRWGGLSHWPVATLLMLWPALGGHFVELFFLNAVRPRLPAARAAQVGGRLTAWFAGGAALGFAMWLTARVLDISRVRWPAWWVAGLAFIGIELTVHLVLQIRGRPSFYNGRG
jgi:hypothetical protein